MDNHQNMLKGEHKVRESLVRSNYNMQIILTFSYRILLWKLPSTATQRWMMGQLKCSCGHTVSSSSRRAKKSHQITATVATRTEGRERNELTCGELVQVRESFNGQDEIKQIIVLYRTRTIEQWTWERGTGQHEDLFIMIDGDCYGNFNLV